MRTVGQRWPETRLDRVADLNARIGWRALTATEYVEHGYAFLSTPNIKGAEIDFANVNYINEFRYEESPELKLAEGDVLLAKDGNTLGITNVVATLPRPATVNGSIAVIRPHAIDGRFLRYVLDSAPIQGRIQAFKDGMGVPHLFQWDINRFPLPNPPLAEQRAIADYLDVETARIDALIAKKQQLIHLLEERAWAAVRELVRAGMQEADCTQTIPWLGKVANTWDVPLVGVIGQIHRGTSFPADQQGRPAGDLPFLKVADLGTERATYVDSIGNWISDAVARELQAHIAPAGSVAYARVGAALLLNPRKILRRPTILDDNVRAIEFSIGDSRYWAYVLSFLDLGELANPGPVPSISEGQVASARVPCPPVAEQKEIADEADRLVHGNRRTSAATTRQISLLTERRQALITAAVTGEFAVPGAP